MGRLEEAAIHFRKALALRPGFKDAHQNLGVVLADLGRLDEAALSYRQALTLDPGMAEAHSNLGNVLRNLRRMDEAAACYRQAIALRPDFADAHQNLGNALHDLGRLEEAADSYQAALALQPGSIEALGNLGATRLDQGRIPEAIDCLVRALALQPRQAGALFNLALALRAQGDSPGALTAIRGSLTCIPTQAQAWMLLGELLIETPTYPEDPPFLGLLVELLDRPDIHPGSLSRPVYGVLRRHAGFASVLDDSAIESDPRRVATQLSAIPLLLRVMALAATIDLGAERLFTRLRSALLHEVLAGNAADATLPFCCALACQCHLNEYVFEESTPESEGVRELARRLGADIASGPVSPVAVALLAAYHPLQEVAWIDTLLARPCPESLMAVLRQQVLEPREEAELRATLPTLTPVEDDVSLAVREQYEANPYPRWARTRLHASPRPIQDVLRTATPPMDLRAYEGPELPDILVAGCGTGEHALGTASRFLHRRVLAVDLSRASLGYARRKAREAGIATLEFAQADILSLGSLGQTFDIIESAGVLHHMREPLAGWQVLTNLLRPGGLMGIALYSEAARQPVLRGRARIAELGYEPTPEGIRRFRQDTLASADGSDQAWFATCRDFYSTSECRDLLFHVQEHRFTLPQIEAALATLGLRFVGFELPTDLWQRFHAFDPRPQAATALAAWARFEQQHPDAFKGMYQFWCQKA